MSSLLADYIFYEVAALLVLAAGIGFLGLLLRQPLIVSFIAVGIIAGPSVLDIAKADEQIDLLAELGIALLLFLVGLKLDIKLIKTLGKVAVTTGLGQVVFTTLFGFLLCLGLGLDTTTALYVAVALTFSSTIIVVKLLSDKREIDALHGRIALGFLIVQDVVVVIAMIVLSAQGMGGTGDSPITDVLRVLLLGLMMLAFVGLFTRYAANPLMRHLSRSSELMISFAIGWAALLAALGHYFGFGKELGGLLAGVSLASTPFRDALAARLSSVRDFLLLFFFIALGASLDMSALGEAVVPALVLSAFVLIGNPLIVLAIMGIMGYRKRTGFLAGLTVAQISEFSLIFIAMGVELGSVPESALGLVTLVGLITIAASTYMITWSHQLFALIEPLLTPFERRHSGGYEEGWQPTAGQFDIVLFGHGRYGSSIAAEFQSAGYKVLAVDFNPDVVAQLRSRQVATVFGDASDPEFIAHLPLEGIRVAISALPEIDAGIVSGDPRSVLVHALRDSGFKGLIAVAIHSPGAGDRAVNVGADLLLKPYEDAAAQAVERIVRALDNPTEGAGG